MLVKDVMSATENLRSFDFLNNILPKFILSNSNLISKNINISKELEKEVGLLWETYCENNNYPKDPYPDFDFIYTSRLRLNREKGLNSSLFFLRMPEADGIDKEDTPISCAFLLSDNGTMRFFALKDLPDDLLPERFIKNNETCLLYELDEGLKFTNWGKLINPRNFSELSESIFHIADV